MKHYLEQIPLYLAGQLDPAETATIEKHLSGCPACQNELLFWRNLAGEITKSDSRITAPVGLVERALRRSQVEESGSKNVRGLFVSARYKTTFSRTLNLLRAQAYLIKREMWPTSAAVMALGVIVAALSDHVEAIIFIAPLVAATSQAMLYGPEYDPAHELALATPTSQWKVLLARLSVVSAYNLLLALLASLAAVFLVPLSLLGMVILGWLAPLAFLSALALLLTVWIGTRNAIIISYGLWILQFVQLSKILNSGWYSGNWTAFLSAYRSFWQSPVLLLVFSLVLLGAALLSTRFTERGLTQYPA